MGPYSHYILAGKAEPFVQPEERGAYYWGAVAPDVRYLANLRREHTHLELDKLKELMARHPGLRSFLLGYQVHLLIDQIDVAKTVGRAFPMNLLKKVLGKRLPPEQMTMLVEMYYLQNAAAPGVALAGEHNAVFAELGVTAEHTCAYHQALSGYFAGRTFEAALGAFQKIGMIQNTRVEKYQRAFRRMQSQKLLNGLLMLSIKNARLDARAVEHIRAAAGAAKADRG